MILDIVRPPVPRGCYVGDRAERAAAYRHHELVMWADAVMYRGLRITSLDPLDRFVVSSELKRRECTRS